MLTTGAIEFLGALASGGIGGTLMVTGLSRWLGEVWLGRILAKEKAKHDQQLDQLRAGYAEKLEGYKDALDRSKHLLQAQIDRSVFVTRAHFETEFEAYKKIFEDLAEVRLLMTAMHPMLRVARKDESREDRFKELTANLLRLADAHDKAARTTENVGPFYPQEVLEKVNRCLQLVRIEILNVQTEGERTFSAEWSRQGEDRVNEFLLAYKETSDAVRQRIATLAILPSQ
jgi:hypothetical protein